jgi:hypothetical protein
LRLLAKEIDMEDGAHLNVGAESAMKSIIGGSEPTVLTDEQFEEMIRTADLDRSPVNYDMAANQVARLVLEAYEKYPRLQTMPDYAEYIEVDDGGLVPITTTLTDVIFRIYKGHKALSGISGFQWGWGVNAARKILNLGPLPNPALLEISPSDEAHGATTSEVIEDDPGGQGEVRE